MTTMRIPEEITARCFDDGVLLMRMREPFTVDGIEYHDPRYADEDTTDRDTVYVRQMIEIRNDETDHRLFSARMNWTAGPLTEVELLVWVRSGYLHQPRTWPTSERTTP